MASLDEDLLTKVFSFLPGNEVALLAVTCSAWKLAVDQPFMWKSLLHDHYSSTNLKEVCEGVLDMNYEEKCDEPHDTSAKAVYTRAYRMTRFASAKWCSLESSDLTKRFEHREGHCVVRLDRWLICIAGWGRHQHDNSVQVAQLSQLQRQTLDWVEVVPANRPINPTYGHTATVVSDSRILVIGGFSRGGYGGAMSQVASLHMKPPRPDRTYPTFEWEIHNIQPEETVARAYHSAVYVPSSCFEHPAMYPQGCVMVFGGNCRGRVTGIDGLRLFDLDTNKWIPRDFHTVGDRVISPRNGLSSHLIRGQVYLCGGGNGRNVPRDGIDFSDVFRVSCKDWTVCHVADCPSFDGEEAAPCASLALGRSHASCVVGNSIIFFGGSVRLTNRVVVYDTRSNQWFTPKSIQGALIGRQAHTLTFTGKHIVMTGGFNPIDELDVTCGLLELEDSRFRSFLASSTPHYGLQERQQQMFVNGMGFIEPNLLSFLAQLIQQGEGAMGRDEGEDEEEGWL